ncbi:4Fe-4S binding protein [Acutalibacter sp. 1XD8-33]|uniref:4Fe-4S binding protein n=1 Tax=Acutalibacter sp. 1XD8-33 TaxID=2320081 RepID=UPI000EA37244|nr:4Fe-4S binding protein [Acutalibacter sp. 1XD8-33]RKJ40928.1 4Fe-4S binding protein [Acutalibacter sp. 1XD8-33]
MSGMHRNRVKKGRLSFQRTMQLFAAALFNGYALGFGKGKIFTGPSKSLCVPVLNCYSCPGALGACPIGSLQAALGGANRRFPFYIAGTLLLFGVLLGRAVCGLLCPFGLIQDLLHKIPVPKISIPKKWDRPARYLKYVVLFGMVLLLPALAVTETSVGTPFFCKYLCPAGTLEGGIPLLLSNPLLRQAAGLLFSWKLLVLGIILAASALIHRPFCKYLCPLGALYSLFHRFSFYQMHLDKNKCVDCKACEQACPMNVEITKTIQSPECIRCGKCKSVCPHKAISSGFALDRNRPDSGGNP